MPNGGVDAAARFHSTIAGPIMMRNTLPPLASNDLLCASPANGRAHPAISHAHEFAVNICLCLRWVNMKRQHPYVELRLVKLTSVHQIDALRFDAALRNKILFGV